MKKITLFIFLLISSLGFSQTFPLDFSDPLDLMIGYDGCVVTITTDAGNSVLQVVGSGQNYDTAQLILSGSLDLSNNANNTITFRVKPTTGSGNGSHLLKFEGGAGGPATCELPFTTAGTAWQNITLDFPAGLGNYNKVVLFTDFANALTGTYLFDDFAGGTNIAAPPPLAVPSGPAPVPTRLAANVISMYGETYPNTYQYSFGSVAGEPDLDPTAAVNLALKLNFAVAGFGAGYTQTNISTMQFLHFDYWTPNATTFGFYAISNGPVVEKAYRLPDNEAVVLNTWKSVDVPLSFFTTGAAPINPLTWFQYKFDVNAATPGTVYFDNMYYYKNPLGVDSFTANEFIMYPNPASTVLNIEASKEIQAISVFNLLGQEVIKVSGSSNEQTIDVSSLVRGIYVVKIQSEGITTAKKFTKE